MIKRILFIFFGLFFLFLAILGAFLPLLPSTPFALLAIFFFSRSSSYLHNICLNMPLLGGPLRNWQNHRTISLPSKTVASVLLIITLGHVLSLPSAPVWIKMAAGGFMFGVIAFIWLQKSHPSPT